MKMKKLDADWTYLIMRVRQMKANMTSMEKILNNERTNERTNGAKIHE